MKYAIIRLIILAGIGLLLPLEVSAAASKTNAIERLLGQLDSLVVHERDHLISVKENRLAQLHAMNHPRQNDEERYWSNKRLYDEYCVYDADSAMRYATANLELAQQYRNPERAYEWRIKRSFLLAATGLLKEALDELKGMSGSMIEDDNLKADYYAQMLYIILHLNQYVGEERMDELHQRYDRLNLLYRDSLNRVVSPSHPQYLWYKGQGVYVTDSMASFRSQVEQRLANARYDTRDDAINAYLLASFYKESLDEELYLTYLIYSAMADVRTCNRDVASLEELAKVLFASGDIERSYIYMNYCLKNALVYRNRVRVVGISAVQDDIHHAYQQRDLQQRKRLSAYLWVVSVLSIVLLGSLFFIYKQMRRLQHSRQLLNEVNSQLNLRVGELDMMQKQMIEANNQLTSLNVKLKEMNMQLKESNYVKEEYIGYVFSICSNYISKLEEFRKNINRKLKGNLIDEVRTLVDSPSLAQNELKEFYHSFDTIFLHIYPNFVSDFNALLRPDEQIMPKEGELLNTELRIYALVRLGISDSVKIAEFLHYSSQTVYNNRLRTRNKAIIPKEDFAATVRQLGKAEN